MAKLNMKLNIVKRFKPKKKTVFKLYRFHYDTIL